MVQRLREPVPIATAPTAPFASSTLPTPRRPSNINATASDGSITLVTPPGLSAEIDAGTGDGSIHTDLPVTIRGKVGKSLHGTIGGGEGRVYLRTQDGSITIR